MTQTQLSTISLDPIGMSNLLAVSAVLSVPMTSDANQNAGRILSVSIPWLDGHGARNIA